MTFTPLASAKPGAVEKASADPSADPIVQMMKLYYDNARSFDSKYRNPELEKAFHEHVIREMKSEQDKNENRREVIRWTNLSANLTFAVAHAFLAFGLYAAIQEWRHATRMRQKGKAESVDIEVKMESLAMKGVQVGFLIFMLSFVFYFLYLKFVYPILTV